MFPTKILSTLGLLSSFAIPTFGEINQTGSDVSLKKLQVLNRCSENVPNHFVVPETLKYAYYTAKRLESLAQTINAPLFEFSLSVNELTYCQNGTFNLTVPIANNGNVGGKSEQVFLNFTADGSVNRLVVINEEEYLEKEILYHKDNFCISSITPDTITLNFCKSKCYLDEFELGANLCVPRCCAFGAIMSGHDKNVSECIATDGSEWAPEIFANGNSETPESHVHAQLLVNDVSSIEYWNCTGDRYTDRILDTSTLRFLSDGRVVLKTEGDEWEEIFSGEMPYKFCVDGYWDLLKSDDYVIDSSLVLRQCYSKEAQEANEKWIQRKEAVVLKTKIQIFLVLVPCAIIYLVVLVIYLSIWDKHRAHGWTVVGFAIVQFLAYVLLIALLSSFVFGDFARFVTTSLNGVCVFFGIAHHFFSISTYSWTAVLTFDMWTTLSSIRPESSRSTRKVLTAYMGFAIGLPVFIVFIVATTLEFIPQVEYIVTPGYRKGCTVPGGKPFLFYIGVTNTILFIANLVFAALTFRSLWAASKMASKMTTSKKEATFGDKAALMAKLLLVMGVSLAFEFILNFAELTKYSQYFAILEVYRILQAGGLFWTFVCGARTQQHLREKFPEIYKKIFAKRTEEVSSGMTMTTISK